MLHSPTIRASERQIARDRMQSLLERSPEYRASQIKTADSTKTGARIDATDTEQSLSWLGEMIMQAGLASSPANTRPWIVYAIAAACGSALALGSAAILAPYFVPLFFLAGLRAPFSYLEARIQKRAMEFAEDYPTVLLATASSMKVGMTAYAALERSIKLLPEKSLVRSEVQKLVADLRQGLKKEEALQRFGQTIRQPDLALFRSAFLLVLENGGRFAPTLQRLATVSKDRSVLISAARVSTASMRMTANIILAVTPLIVGVIAARTEKFWDLLLHHPVANTMASAGIVIIFFCFIFLKRMSNFKP